MKIVITGINFAPELTGIGKYTSELTEWLVQRGHHVTIVTAMPYYPQWQVGEQYKGSLWTGESYAGARVIRCPLWVPSQPTGMKRILHASSFALSSLPVMLALAFTRPDVVIAIAPSLICAPVVITASRLAGCESWLHVQDFEVDAALSLGFSGGFARGAARGLERRLMSKFSRVSTISTRMVEQLEQKGVTVDRSVLFPNWVNTDIIAPVSSSPLRAELGVPNGAVVALFSGSMTRKQGLHILSETAKRLRTRSDLHFVFCGEGVERAALIDATSACTNVHFLPLQSAERLNALLNLADIHLLPQLRGAADLVMPSKLQGMFASGRPVVATAEPGTQLADTVNGRGIVVAPEAPDAMAKAILELVDNPRRRASLGASARRYAVDHWSKEAVLHEFELQLQRCVGADGAFVNQHRGARAGEQFR